MSRPKEQKPRNKKGRARVGNLPVQEKELKAREAKNIKGGQGGVEPQVRHIGEEIPQ